MNERLSELDQANPILEAVLVSKNYVGVRALSNVTFSIRPGTIHALVGENGAGKSTLMRILAGDERASSGQLQFDGAPVEFLGPKDARDVGIAMVYQDLTIIPTLSVAENLSLGKLPGRGWVNRDELYRSARLGLERIGADIDVGREASTLSPGEAQQVEIARAMLTNPSVLVLDEPTSSLSETESARLSQTLLDLRDEGVAIVYVTHRLRDALALADEATVLRDGEVVERFTRGELSLDTLVRAMVGHAVTDAFPKTPAEIGGIVLEVTDMSVLGGEPFDFHVRAGEIVGLAGLVGSGRSETLRAIAGVDKTVAVVRMTGGRVRRNSVPASQGAGIGFVPEERKRDGIIPTFSVSKMLTLSVLHRLCVLGALSGRRERLMATRLIERLGVSPSVPSRRVTELSGGNQQKTVVGRAIARGAKVLLLDDPTRGVDVAAKAEVHRVVGDLVGEGMGVVMASSEMIEVLAVSDRVLVFADGTIVAEFERHEATEERVMAAMAGVIYEAEIDEH